MEFTTKVFHEPKVLGLFEASSPPLTLLGLYAFFSPLLESHIP
ncbi:hypothetical protein AALP_AA6G354800 [Arabis alpina]|uniref:Uncharacterized protein n=1 Tax=Arabis alpina TaxID=50452 RepID=A0A087GTT1_ARAAL|nr:hypothetical protein AALP_AA6G354800 [Arabis alpina]